MNFSQNRTGGPWTEPFTNKRKPGITPIAQHIAREGHPVVSALSLHLGLKPVSTMPDTYQPHKTPHKTGEYAETAPPVKVSSRVFAVPEKRLAPKLRWRTDTDGCLQLHSARGYLGRIPPASHRNNQPRLRPNLLSTFNGVTCATLHCSARQLLRGEYQTEPS